MDKPIFTLYFRSFPEEQTYEDLHALFSKHGNIVKLFIHKTRTYGMVEYDNISSCTDAIRNLHNRPPLNLHVNMAKNQPVDRKPNDNSSSPPKKFYNKPRNPMQEYNSNNTDFDDTDTFASQPKKFFNKSPNQMQEFSNHNSSFDNAKSFSTPPKKFNNNASTLTPEDAFDVDGVMYVTQEIFVDQNNKLVPVLKDPSTNEVYVPIKYCTTIKKIVKKVPKCMVDVADEILSMDNVGNGVFDDECKSVISDKSERKVMINESPNDIRIQCTVSNQPEPQAPNLYRGDSRNSLNRSGSDNQSFDNRRSNPRESFDNRRPQNRSYDNRQSYDNSNQNSADQSQRFNNRKYPNPNHYEKRNYDDSKPFEKKPYDNYNRYPNKKFQNFVRESEPISGSTDNRNKNQEFETRPNKPTFNQKPFQPRDDQNDSWDNAETNPEKPLKVEAAPKKPVEAPVIKSSPAKVTYPIVDLPKNEFTEVLVETLVNDSVAWVQITSKATDFVNITSSVISEALSAAPLTAQVGSLCLAKFDNVWYRAVILSTSPKLTVRYIDFGNECTNPEGGLLKMSPELSAIPAQAVCIKLAEGAPLKLKSELLLKVKQVAVDDDKLVVHVENGIYDAKEKEEIKVVHPLNQIQKALCDNLTASSTGTIERTIVLSKTSFVAAILPDSLTDVQQKLMSLKPDTTNTTFQPKVGIMACAENDDGLNRVFILKVEDNSFKVAFIDYGTIVTVSQVKPIPNDFAAFPQHSCVCTVSEADSDKIEKLPSYVHYTVKQASKTKITCQIKDLETNEFLFDCDITSWIPVESESKTSTDTKKPAITPEVKPQTPPETTSREVTQTVEKPVNKSVTSSEQPPLDETAKKVNAFFEPPKDTAIRRPKVQSSPRSPFANASNEKKQTIPELNLINGEDVKIIFVDGNKLYLRTKQGNLTLKNITTYLNENALNAATISDTPAVGDYLMAKFGNDWYRAIVNSIQQERVNITYIDFGNDEIKPFFTLKSLSPLMFAEPVTLVKVTLKNFTKECFSPKTVDYLQEISEKSITMKAHFDETIADGVELIMKDGSKLNDEILKLEGLRKSINARLERKPTDEMYLTVPIPTEQDPCITNPNVQELPMGKSRIKFLSCTDLNIRQIAACLDSPFTDKAFGELSEQITKYGDLVAPKEPYKPQIEEAILVQHSDGKWYRALVISISRHSCGVFFIDHAITIFDIPLEKIRKIPMAFMEIDAVAVFALIHGIPDNPSEKLQARIQSILEPNKCYDVTTLDKTENDEYVIVIPYLLDILKNEQLI